MRLLGRGRTRCNAAGVLLAACLLSGCALNLTYTPADWILAWQVDRHSE